MLVNEKPDMKMALYKITIWEYVLAILSHFAMAMAILYVVRDGLVLSPIIKVVLLIWVCWQAWVIARIFAVPLMIKIGSISTVMQFFGFVFNRNIPCLFHNPAKKEDSHSKIDDANKLQLLNKKEDDSTINSRKD